MYHKFKVLCLVVFSMVTMILLFIICIGCSNYFRSINYKIIANILTVLLPVITFIYVRYFNIKFHSLYPNSYGFNATGFLGKIAFGIGFSILITLFILVIASNFFAISFTIMPLKWENTIPMMKLLMSTLSIALWEEFFFRGLIFNTLIRNKFGFHTSALISAFLFSIIHFSSFEMQFIDILWFLGIIFIGYILAFIYTITNSIWTVVSFHFMWNLIARLLDEKLNNVGIITIHNFNDVAQSINMIIVITLGIISLILISISKKKVLSHKIEIYINQVANYCSHKNHIGKYL